MSVAKYGENLLAMLSYMQSCTNNLKKLSSKKHDGNPIPNAFEFRFLYSMLKHGKVSPRLK